MPVEEIPANARKYANGSSYFYAPPYSIWAHAVTMHPGPKVLKEKSLNVFKRFYCQVLDAISAYDLKDMQLVKDGFRFLYTHIDEVHTVFVLCEDSVSEGAIIEVARRIIDTASSELPVNNQ